MNDAAGTTETPRRPGTPARVAFFLLSLGGSWILLFLGFPLGAPDRLPVLILALALALWTARRTDQGILAFCFLLPCTGLIVRLCGGTDPTTWPALLFGGLAVGWTFRFIYDFESAPEPSAIDRPLRALILVWLMATVLAICRAGTLWALTRGLVGRAVNGDGLDEAEAIRESVFALSSLAAGVGFFFLLRRSGDRLRRRALRAAYWGCSLSALAALLQRIEALPPETRRFWKLTGRIAGGAIDPNSLGLLCALLLVVAMTRWLSHESPGVFEILAAVFLVLGLFLSGSRSGLLILLLSLFLLVLTASGISRRSRVAGALIFAAGLLALALLMTRATPGTLGARLAESLDPKLPIEYRVSERPALWRAAARLFWNHPLEGGGMGSFAWRLPDLLRDENRRLPMRDNPGNAYLQALAETGIIGFVITLAFVFTLGRIALSRARERPGDAVSAGAGVSVSAFVLAMGLGSHWFAPDVALVFFLLVSIATGARRKESSATSVWSLRAAVLLYTAAAVIGMLATARPEEAFRYSPRLGFYPLETSPGGPFRWTRGRFALWLAPGETSTLSLARFTPDPQPAELVARRDDSVVWRESIAAGRSTLLRLSARSDRPSALQFHVSRTFVPRRLRISDDPRELGLLAVQH
jgi:O-antigen ligase